jgi:hypothetical protein
MDQEPGRRLHLAIRRIADLTRGRPFRGVLHDDADGQEGTIASDDAIGFDPLPVLRGLAEQGAPAVVMGQVAGIMHGSAELTGDLDLLWSGEPDDAVCMADAFVALRAELFDETRVPLGDVPAAFALAKVLFRAPSASGDCCTPHLPWGGLDVTSFLDRAMVTEVDGVLIRYLALGDLVAMRVMASRPKDLRRLAELERLRASPLW